MVGGTWGFRGARDERVKLRILCIGDVVGRPGRRLLAHHLRGTIRNRRIDCVVANLENMAGGSGLTPNLFNKALNYGVSVATTGDHVYRDVEITSTLEESDRIVKPANLSPLARGKDFVVYQTASGVPVAVFQLLGRMFIRPTDCPFRRADELLGQIPGEVKVVVVDMHAEANGEKVAMGWHLDGRVSVVFGTHTHIPTADARVLPDGTAYITDVGMTGPYDSVLGRRKERVLYQLTTQMPTPFHVAEGDPRLCAVLCEIDADTGRAESIERVEIRGLPGDSPEEPQQ